MNALQDRIDLADFVAEQNGLWIVNKDGTGGKQEYSILDAGRLVVGFARYLLGHILTGELILPSEFDPTSGVRFDKATERCYAVKRLYGAFSGNSSWRDVVKLDGTSLHKLDQGYADLDGFDSHSTTSAQAAFTFFFQNVIATAPITPQNRITVLNYIEHYKLSPAERALQRVEWAAKRGKATNAIRFAHGNEAVPVAIPTETA